MSQNKYKLPVDVKAAAISMVRGYSRRVAWYQAARESIIHGGACNYFTYKKTIVMPNGSQKVEMCRQYFSHGSIPGDPTQDKVIRLERLEDTVEVKRMRAVEQGALRVALDVKSDEEREKIRTAVLDSCIEGRHFNFEYRVLCVGKTNFYKRRLKFLYEIAQNTEFL